MRTRKLAGFRLWALRLYPRRTFPTNDHFIQGKNTQVLAALIQTLTLAEKAADATPIPYLKGVIGMVLVMVECAQVSIICIQESMLTLKPGVPV